MKKFVKAAYFTGDTKWLERFGDTVWDQLCFDAPLGDPATIDHFQPGVCELLNTTPEQARVYIRLVIANVIAEHEQKQTGECPVRRAGRSFVFL